MIPPINHPLITLLIVTPNSIPWKIDSLTYPTPLFPIILTLFKKIMNPSISKPMSLNENSLIFFVFSPIHSIVFPKISKLLGYNDWTLVHPLINDQESTSPSLIHSLRFPFLLLIQFFLNIAQILRIIILDPHFHL